MGGLAAVRLPRPGATFQGSVHFEGMGKRRAGPSPRKRRASADLALRRALDQVDAELAREARALGISALVRWIGRACGVR